MAFAEIIKNGKNAVKKLLDVRPRDETDYYGIGGWMVSRKLAFLLVLIAAAACAAVIVLSIPNLSGEDADACRVYKYNSIGLKLISDRVKILGKSGYTAYVGDMDRGVAKGTGTLYSPDGQVVYSGSFDRNMYNGEGRCYYAGTKIWYAGSFRDNLFDGEGTTYREDGTKWYSGSFAQGYMEGTGQLYGRNGQPVYKGTFRRDNILYTELLGKSAAQVREQYTGELTVYESSSDYCVCMEDIGALYFGDAGANRLDADIKVAGVYVLSGSVAVGPETAADIRAAKKLLGEPLYEGNTALSIKDKAALLASCRQAAQTREEPLYGKPDMVVRAVFDDVFEITDGGGEYLAYMYVFEKDSTVYTFYCKDRDGGFAFYMLS